MSISPTSPGSPVAFAYDARAAIEQLDPDMDEGEAFSEVMRRVRAETRAQQERFSQPTWAVKG